MKIINLIGNEYQVVDDKDTTTFYQGSFLECQHYIDNNTKVSELIGDSRGLATSWLIEQINNGVKINEKLINQANDLELQNIAQGFYDGRTWNMSWGWVSYIKELYNK